jgi:hypothetical protein
MPEERVKAFVARNDSRGIPNEKTGACSTP